MFTENLTIDCEYPTLNTVYAQNEIGTQGIYIHMILRTQSVPFQKPKPQTTCPRFFHKFEVAFNFY